MFHNNSIVIVRATGKRGRIIEKFTNTNCYLVDVEDEPFVRVLSDQEMKPNEGIELPSYDHI